MKLSALVIFQNNRDTLERCLTSLAFCDEIVAINGGSVDGSREFASRLGCRVMEHPFEGVNHQKEFGRRLVRGEWILNLDSDEYVSPLLAEEILQTLADEPRNDGFRFPVRSRIEDRWIRYGGWWPNRQKRLFRTEKGCWNPAVEPHDRVELQGKWRSLVHPIEHNPPGGLEHLREKSERYGLQAARAMFENGRRYPLGSRWVRPAWRGVKSYVFQAGFFEGVWGWRWAACQTLEGWTKYETLRKLHTEKGSHGQIPGRYGIKTQNEPFAKEKDHDPIR